MDKSQAIHNFWSQFGLPAYDENTVNASKAGDRYITYNVETDSIGSVLNLYGNIWDMDSTSWEFLSRKAEEIAETIERKYPISYGIDNGRLYIAKGTPFAQRMSDPSSDRVRRMYILIQAEFLTAF